MTSCSSVPSASRKLPVAERASAATAGGGISIASASAVRRTTLAICSTVGRWKSKRWQRSTTVAGTFVGLGRGEHEHGVRRRLLERLQERVPGRRREHVRLVEDVDLAAPADGRVGDALAQLADVVDRVVRRGVHLDHVERGGARRSSRHDSQPPHGSIVGPCSQFRHAARIFAIEVLPVPREPTNRYAWWTLPRSTALRSVRTTGSWPTTSANVRGRCRRYSDRCCSCGCSSDDTVGLSLSTPGGAAAAPRRRARRVASADMSASIRRNAWRVSALPGIILGAVLLRVISGVGFVNYDTLYALAWGGQLSRGSVPDLRRRDRAHAAPAARAARASCSRRSARTRSCTSTVAFGFLALSACGWVLYRLGAEWFGRAAGRTRGADLPDARAGALLRRARVRRHPLPRCWCSARCSSRRSAARSRRSARAPVLVLLALAGLLRPEAWAFSGLYWLYCRCACRQRADTSRAQRASSRCRLTLLAAAAPLLWVASDLLITGDAAVVADAHQTHRQRARPRERDRERARVHPAADRRDPAPGGARRRGARRRAVAAVAADARAAGRARGRHSGRRVRAVRRRRAADQHALRVWSGGDPQPVLRRRRVRLDAPRARGPAPRVVGRRRRGGGGRAVGGRALAVPRGAP